MSASDLYANYQVSLEQIENYQRRKDEAKNS